MSSITLVYNENSFIAKNTIEYLLNIGVFSQDCKLEVLNYDKINFLKEKQNDLISRGIIQNQQMNIGFSQEERKIFDNGISIEDLFTDIAR